MKSTVCCYFFLIFWIIIVTTGLYWILAEAGRSQNSAVVVDNRGANANSHDDNDKGDLTSDYSDTALEVDDYSPGKLWTNQDRSQPIVNLDNGSSRQKQSDIERLCNQRETIKAKDEYFQHQDFKLDAVIILFRHGDRGPLSHLGNLNLSHINCQDSHPEYLELLRFVNDMNKFPGYSQFIGPFHSFPRVSTVQGCSLGQLTASGVMQLLTLGKLVRSVYDSSGLFGNASFTNVKVTAYSTRYRRTFQSMLSFLYGLLGSDRVIPSVTITESQSTAFCFNHCSCKGAERLKKEAAKIRPALKHEKEAMSKVVSELNSLLQVRKPKKTAASLLDSLLVYACHHSPLPCRQRTSSSTKRCITPENLQTLIDLLEGENERLKNSLEFHRHALLTSYGLIKELLNLALRMTSATDPELIRSHIAVLSGHDKTLQGLLGALGVTSGHRDLNLLPYASRFIIEVYRWRTLPENSPRRHFLRFVYNGEAITHLVDFCHEPLVIRDKSGQNIELCSMESLVRFFHDTYFDVFPKGVVNFKEACHLVR